MKFGAFHPDDLPLPFDDGPFGSVCSADFEALQNFLDFPGSGRVAEGDSVAGAPVADERRGGGLIGLGAETKTKCDGFPRDGKLNVR